MSDLRALAEVPHCRRPLLVGEVNPHSADPRRALWPSPPGAAGDRLRRILDMSEAEYLLRFSRANLCSGTWSVRAARAEALRLLGAGERPLVLLGARVCRAFAQEFRPFSLGWITPFGQESPIISHYVALPHPSGRSRLWNEPGAPERARAALREAGILP